MARCGRRAFLIVALGVIAAAASLVAGGETSLLDGLLYDLSLAATDRRPGTRDEPVAVIALDRESLGSEELAAVPRVFMSPAWAKLVNALTDADVKAIGFDIIFSYSANRFPGLPAQYDRDFLAALARDRSHVVLARSAQSYPAAPFVAAVFDPASDAGRADPASIGYAELTPDADGVFRHVGRRVESTEGRALPTLAAALLDRALAPAMPEHVLLAPRWPLEAIPAYRLIDVLRCIERDPAALRREFAGKLVLIGSTLPEEDRKRSPDRFMSPPVAGGSTSGACRLDRLGASDPGSRTSPGVFIHAAAVEAVLTGNLLRPVPPAGRAAAAAITAIVGAVLGFTLSPLIATLAVLVLVGVSLAAAPASLGFGWWFPAVLPAVAAITAMAIAYIVRFLVEDRRRRRVQRAFGHYLAPAIVAQLLDSEAPLRLGGEEREVTIMFADLSGFTALSGKVGPSELMAVTNEYLGIIAAAVEETGGYVDKFIGDAVMAIWGAPGPHPDHAAAAARAALGAVDAVLRAKEEADASARPGYAVKIGLNSGRAVVGNVGAADRYNYTAVGETVNIAARLEGVPGDYGCRIVVGPVTAAAIADRFVLNELDWVKLKGKAEPIAIYELLGAKATASAAMLAYAREYHDALARYRAGDFAAAETCWRQHTIHPYLVGSSPPAIMAERAAELVVDPPAEWDGVYVRSTK